MWSGKGIRRRKNEFSPTMLSSGWKRTSALCSDWRWCLCIKALSHEAMPNKALLQKSVYYYRHSRARRLSENLFGILANRWRFMRNVLLLHQDVIEILVSAALVLHNFLRESDAYCPTGLLDTESVTGEVLTGWWCQDLSFSAMGPGYSSVY